MRQLWLGLFVLLSGCNDFEAALRNRCLDGGFDAGSACERFRGDGGRADHVCNENGCWGWENPGGGLGGADLFALFGTTDSDVWVAGAGNTLMHWNGTRWEQARSALPPAIESDPLSPERAFRTVTVSDGGEVWLSGESTRVLTGPPFVDKTSITGFDLLTTWKGTVYGMRRGLWALSGSSVEQRSELDFEAFHSMAFTDEGCFVSVHSSTGFTGVVDCADGGIDLDLTSSDGGAERLMALFTLTDGGLGVTGGHGNVFLRNGRGNWPELGLAGYDQSTKANYGTLHAATRLGHEVWLTGQSGAVIKLTESLTSAVVRAPNTNNPTLSTAWTSRDGTFWAAGRGGALLRIDAGTPGPAAAVSPPFAVVDVWADPQRQVAVLANTDLLVRNTDAGTWTPKRTFQGSAWVAGVGSGARMYLLGENGDLYRWDLAQPNPTFMSTVVPGPIARSGVRSGAFGPDGTGKFFVGAGGVVGLLDPSDGGSLKSIVLQSAPNGPSRVVGIARLSNGRTLVAGNVGASGSEVGGLYEVIDGGWTTVQGGNITGAVEHMVRCPNDTVLVVGQQELVTRYSGTAWTPLRAPTTNHVFNAAWCDPRSNAWVLSETGKVFRYSPEGQETVEVTGLGPSTGEQLEANVITGNGTTVFIGGGNSAILSRPWP